MVTSDSEIMVVDCRDAAQKSVGYDEPRSRTFRLEDIRRQFPASAEAVAINRHGVIAKMKL